MTSETAESTSWWTEWRVTVAVVLAALVVLAVGGLITRAGQQREDDRRSDTYYCTLTGVGPYDRGPATGELCVDLLDY